MFLSHGPIELDFGTCETITKEKYEEKMKLSIFSLKNFDEAKAKAKIIIRQPKLTAHD